MVVVAISQTRTMVSIQSKNRFIYFQILGTLVPGSGFEDIIFESGICTSGSLQGVLSGSHYNRAWFVHEIFSEALERLLLTRFLVEKQPRIPAVLRDLSLDPTNLCKSEDALNGAEQLINMYENYRNEARNGKIGLTAQFWIIYMDLMRFQRMALNTVQENDVKTLFFCWKKFLPMYFVFNKFHHARCVQIVFCTD
jgi:hypothetical protein